jgi:hypothetical protein
LKPLHLAVGGTLWERSLLAIGCEAVAKMVNAPAQESRADFIAGKVDRHPGRSYNEICMRRRFRA